MIHHSGGIGRLSGRSIAHSVVAVLNQFNQQMVPGRSEFKELGNRKVTGLSLIQPGYRAAATGAEALRCLW
jgi:hypothetical protein